MRKRITALALAFVMVLGTVALATGTEKTIPVTPMELTVNGQTVTPKKSDGTPAEVFAYDGATYVPLRYLSELLGVQVDWSAESAGVAKLEGVSGPLAGADGYDRTVSAELVIVGAGGAGISAALSAVENGAKKVIILEKTGKTGGALNTTAGTLSGARTVIQELDGLTEDTYESYYEDLMEEGSKDGGIPTDYLLKLYSREAGNSIDWLWKNGLSEYEFQEDAEGHKAVFAPEHTLYSYPRSYKPKAMDGKTYKSAAAELLDRMLSKQSAIEILFDTEARHLICNDKGQVMAVEAVGANGESLLLESGRGILMATGGFSGNPALVAAYSPLNGSVTGNLPTTDGWGLRMMQEVGGYVNTDRMYFPFNPFGLENKSLPGTGRIMSTKTYFCGGVLINQEGKRFVDETSVPVDRQNALAKQTEGKQYEFFTDNVVENLLGCNTHNGMWKMYFATDTGKADIIKADTLEEFETLTGVPANTLRATLESYNACVTAKGTDELGRTYVPTDNIYNAVIDTIDMKGPFYAVVTKCMNNNTLGGISVNESLQVITQDGTAIPGLYAAGECVAVWGRWLSGGCGVNGAITFGRLAGRFMMEAGPMAEGYKPQNAANIFPLSLWEKKTETLGNDSLLKGLKDGTYEASVNGQEGIMRLQVEIQGGKIAAITVLEQHETPSIGAEALKVLPAKVAQGNSIEIEAVSGATLTSIRFMDAGSDCLRQAGGK